MCQGGADIPRILLLHADSVGTIFGTLNALSNIFWVVVDQMKRVVLKSLSIRLLLENEHEIT